jgi:hypothetical protein
VTPSGRAQADTIVNLLDELSVLPEREPALRVLIDETELGAGFVSVLNDQARARAWLLEG